MKLVKRILTIIPVLIFLFAIFIIINVTISVKNRTVPKIFGYSYLTVATGSMSPTISPYDFIIIKETDNYQVNDIVTFYYDINHDEQMEIVTHRIINISEDGIYTVKGDATLEGDFQEITKDKIVGKFLYRSSFLGQIFSLRFLTHKQNIFLILIIIFLLFAIYQFVNIINITKKNKHQN